MKSKEAWKKVYRRAAAGKRWQGCVVDPREFCGMDEGRSPWHETAEDRLRGTRRSRERARKLRWVCAQMELRLSPMEREAIRRHYFQGLSYRAAGRELRKHPASVYRAARRGIKKLRRAAKGTRWYVE